MIKNLHHTFEIEQNKLGRFFCTRFFSILFEGKPRSRPLEIANVTIINNTSRIIRMTLQVVASLTIVILMTLEVSFMLPENIYSTGVTHDDRHMMIKIFL